MKCPAHKRKPYDEDYQALARYLITGKLQDEREEMIRHPKDTAPIKEEKKR